MNIYGMTRKDLEDYFLAMGEKKFKALQVYEWLYTKKVKSFKEMTNLKKEVISKLEKDFVFNELEIKEVQKGDLVR